MIDLSLQDIRFMLTVLPLRAGLREKLETLVSVENTIASDDVADDLRDLCAESLNTYGFAENYDPTEEGEKLEALIDKLYVG